jgi:glutathione S-transferase
VMIALRLRGESASAGAGGRFKGRSIGARVCGGRDAAPKPERPMVAAPGWVCSLRVVAHSALPLDCPGRVQPRPAEPYIRTMITVHHLNNSRSQRVLWLLEELALPYEIVHYQRDAQTMLAPPSLRAVHPLGKSPVVTTDDGLTLAESGAIIETLIERYGNGRLAPAAGTPEALRYRYWLHFAEGSAMPPLLLKLLFDKIESSRMPFFAKPIARSIAGKARAAFISPNIVRHLDFMEAELGKSEWFAGDDFTGADIQMSFPVEASKARGGLDAKRPKLMAYLARIHARPAYQRALERGGPYGLK